MSPSSRVIGSCDDTRQAFLVGDLVLISKSALSTSWMSLRLVMTGSCPPFVRISGLIPTDKTWHNLIW